MFYKSGVIVLIQMIPQHLKDDYVINSFVKNIWNFLRIILLNGLLIK